MLPTRTNFVASGPTTATTFTVFFTRYSQHNNHHLLHNDNNSVTTQTTKTSFLVLAKSLPLRTSRPIGGRGHNLDRAGCRHDIDHYETSSRRRRQALSQDGIDLSNGTRNSVHFVPRDCLAGFGPPTTNGQENGGSTQATSQRRQSYVGRR